MTVRELIEYLSSLPEHVKDSEIDWIDIAYPDLEELNLDIKHDVEHGFRLLC